MVLGSGYVLTIKEKKSIGEAALMYQARVSPLKEASSHLTLMKKMEIQIQGESSYISFPLNSGPCFVGCHWSSPET
jgi:hypothetical protein